MNSDTNNGAQKAIYPSSDYGLHFRVADGDGPEHCNNALCRCGSGVGRRTVASIKTLGVNIYNEQNEKIGDINDVIIDSSGKVDGVVVSVGGFLGMGEHDVMMSMNKIKFANKAGTTTTGSTGSGSKQWYPDRGTINATKDQLKAMQQFKY